MKQSRSDLRQSERRLALLPGLPGKALVALYSVIATLPMLAVMASGIEAASPLSELGTAFALTATALIFLQFRVRDATKAFPEGWVSTARWGSIESQPMCCLLSCCCTR
jgi:hypothetical protein